MREYAKVTPCFWTGRTGRGLRKDPDAQITALYLMTSQHANMLGLYYCPVAYIVADTGLTEEGAYKALQRLSEERFCTYDWESEWVWVHEMARFQIADQLKANDKQVFGIRNELEKIPSLRIKKDFIEKYRKAFHIESPKKPSPSEGPSKPLRSQEQEQEQEQEPEQEVLAPTVLVGDKPPTEKKAKAPTCPFQKIADAWVEATRSLAVPKPVAEWSDARKAAMRARWREKWDLGKYHDEDAGVAYWRKLFAFVEASDFLTGRAAPSFGRDTPFFADIDWVFNQKNLSKIIEGKYVNREPEAVPA